jgi:O-antigen ligase
MVLLRRFYDWFIVLIVFSAPVMALAVPHGGTLNYKLLIILGMFTAWKDVKALTRAEVMVFFGLLLLFLTNVLSFVTHTEEVSSGHTQLGKQLYLFMGVFAYALLKPRFPLLWRHVDFFLVVNAIMIAAVAAYDVFYLKQPRALGVAHPILFGDVSIAVFVMTLCRTLYSRTKWLLYLALLFSLFAAVLSQTRGALIVVPLIVIMLFFLLDSLKSAKVRWSIAVIALGVVLAFMIEGSPLRGRIDHTIKDLKTYSQNPSNTTSSTIRLEFWRNSILLWKGSPVLGIGPGDYNVEMKRFIESGKAVNSDELNYLHTPHSNLFNALVTVGIVGLLMHLSALYLVPLLILIKNRVPVRYSIYLITTLTSYFIFGLTTTWSANHAGFSIFMLFFLLGLAAANALPGLERDTEQRSLA